MSTKYSVVIVGMGKRGKHHSAAFKDSDRFEVTGICDIDEGRLAEAEVTTQPGDRPPWRFEDLGDAFAFARFRGERHHLAPCAERKNLARSDAAQMGLEALSHFGVAARHRRSTVRATFA